MAAVLHKIGGYSAPTLPCDINVEVGDYVYIRSDGVLARAMSNDEATMPAIGKVLNKPKENECTITDKLIDEDYTGILPRTSFFISSTVPGGIQDNPPVIGGYYSQLVGFGLSDEKIWIDIDPTNVVVRS